MASIPRQRERAKFKHLIKCARAWSIASRECANFSCNISILLSFIMSKICFFFFIFESSCENIAKKFFGTTDAASTFSSFVDFPSSKASMTHLLHVLRPSSPSVALCSDSRMFASCALSVFAASGACAATFPTRQERRRAIIGCENSLCSRTALCFQYC